ncbi:MAG: DUF2203 domain-containing protein [Anaerolineae bacterium]|nr:MAG: DUF2203 domain-containing protein [Anaerolineae bacterium]
MPDRYFSVPEANVLLPRLHVLVTELQRIRAAIVDAQPEFLPVLEASVTNGGNREASAMLLRFGQVEALVDEIRNTGCRAKDVQMGLVDFLHRRPDGRIVLLCWRLGEDQIGYWHELDSGFQGRQPLV